MKILQLLALVGLCTLVAVVGLLAGARYGYEVGYVQGGKDVPEMTEQAFKQMLAKNGELLTKTCHIWWFGMNHKERSLR